MTTLHPDLEALMPEPVAHIHSDGDFCWDRKPAVAWWPENLFTADQVRQAMLDATERAGKVCPNCKGTFAPSPLDPGWKGRCECADPSLAGAVIVAYALPTAVGAYNEVRIERARQASGPDLWAVRYCGDVLNKQGEWEWEPMPSGRDEDFLARARFDSAEEAIAAAIRGGGQG